MRTLSGWAVAGAGLWILYAGHATQAGTAAPGSADAAPQQAAVTTAVDAAAPDAATDAGAASEPVKSDPAGSAPATFQPAALGSATPEPGTADPGAGGPATGAAVVAPSLGGVPLADIDRVDECLDARVCIDRYLWSLYVRTQKIDTVAVPEQVKVPAKRHGHIRMVTRTVSKFVLEDFEWKDTAAARKAKMSPQDYVIGGMAPAFRLRLYHALRSLEDAGLQPGITSAFRDDYRQTIASGRKAMSDRSFHGGSFRGGYGHGLAADIVSIKGDTHAARLLASDVLWKYVDSHEKELGIGRPYRDFDAPHVGPLDGQEYLSRRGAIAHDNSAEHDHHNSAAHAHRRLAALHDHGGKRAVRATRGSSKT